MDRDEVRIPVGGAELAAWVYRPRDGSGPNPGIMLMQGFSATREDQLDHYCERFAEAGLVTLAFDFRNIGASGGTPRQLIDVREQAKDCDAALHYLRDLDDVDPERVAVWGTSFAGGYALDAAARHPWIAAAICQTPMVDGAAPTPSITPAKVRWMIWTALLDRVRAALRLSPYLVPVIGPPGRRGFITTADAWDGFRKCLGTHTTWRNEVAARVFLTLRTHRPALRATDIAAPLLVQLVEHETVVSNRAAAKAAERAPHGDLREYPGLHHFDVYIDDGFDTLIADQIAFLREHLSLQ